MKQSKEVKKQIREEKRHQKELTRVRKLRQKYGNPLFDKLAMESAILCDYYVLYLDSSRQAKIHETLAVILYGLAFGSLIAGFFTVNWPLTMIFLILGLSEYHDLRIENVYITYYHDKMLDDGEWNKLLDKVKKRSKK